MIDANYLVSIIWFLPFLIAHGNNEAGMEIFSSEDLSSGITSGIIEFG